MKRCRVLQIKMPPWLKKAATFRYGYKKHYVTDEEGLVLGVVTTTAGLNEITNIEGIMDSSDFSQGIPVKADKGYQPEKNKKILERKKLKNHILK